MITSVFSVKFSSSTASCHHLVCRRITAETVVIFNVPPWCNLQHFQSLLSDHFGAIKRVKFLSKPEVEAWTSSSPPPISTVVPAEESSSSSFFAPKPEVRFHDALVVFQSASGVEKLVARKKEEPLVLSNDARKPLIGELFILYPLNLGPNESASVVLFFSSLYG